jgi:hypothetical protein
MRSKEDMQNVHAFKMLGVGPLREDRPKKRRLRRLLRRLSRMRRDC